MTLRRTASPYFQEKDQSILDSPIESLNYSDISNILVGPQSDDTVPLLKDVIDLLNKYPGQKFLVELKSYQDAPENRIDSMVRGLEKTFVSMSEAHQHAVTFISFEQEILKKILKSGILSDRECFWVLEEEQIAPKSQKELAEVVATAKMLGFNGLDLEMGEYLRKSLLVKLAKEEQLTIISWPNFGKRTDGPRFEALAHSVGIDIFTSDLPVDTVISARFDQRVRETAVAYGEYVSDHIRLNNISWEPGEAHFVVGSNVKVNVYAPNQSDFTRGANVAVDQPPSSTDLKNGIKIDLERLSNGADIIVINMVDAGELTDEIRNLIIDFVEDYKLVLMDPMLPITNLNTIDRIRKHLQLPLKNDLFRFVEL